MNREQFYAANRKAVIFSYATMIAKGPSKQEVMAFNTLILERWSNCALLNIKTAAWKLISEWNKPTAESEPIKGSTEEPLTLDGRATDYFSRLYNQEGRNRGDIETAYVVGCSEQNRFLVDELNKECELIREKHHDKFIDIMRGIHIAREIINQFPHDLPYHAQRYGGLSASPLEPLHETSVTLKQIADKARETYTQNSYWAGVKKDAFRAGAKWMRDRIGSRLLPSNPESPSNEWIPVSERLPKADDETVLFVTDLGYVAYGFRHGKSLFRECYIGSEYANVTHWMPLPKPPSPPTTKD